VDCAEDLEEEMKCINLDESNSGPAPKEWLTDEVKKHEPGVPGIGEVSFQRFDNTNCAQWHYKNAIYWNPCGPIFVFTENCEIKKKLLEALKSAVCNIKELNRFYISYYPKCKDFNLFIKKYEKAIKKAETDETLL
jgi:hypothetical protein